MVVQVIKDRFKRELCEGDAEILTIIKNPLKLPKESCPLWSFVTVKEGAQKVRSQDNYQDILALILDFDQAISIKEFQNKYSEYCYYLYTTTSHSKAQDKFRAIVPLSVKYNYSEFKNQFLLECLCEFFENVDPSSFSNFHNLPNMCKDPNDYFFFHNNSEKLFDLNVFEESVKYKARKHQRYLQTKNAKSLTTISNNYSKTMSENARQKYKDVVVNNLEKEFQSIPNFKTGDRYTFLKSFVGKLCNASYPDNEKIFDYNEIESWVFRNCSDKNTKNLVQGLFKKNRGYKK